MSGYVRFHCFVCSVFVSWPLPERGSPGCWSDILGAFSCFHLKVMLSRGRASYLSSLRRFTTWGRIKEVSYCVFAAGPSLQNDLSPKQSNWKKVTCLLSRFLELTWLSAAALWESRLCIWFPVRGASPQGYQNPTDFSHCYRVLNLWQECSSGNS